MFEARRKKLRPEPEAGPRRAFGRDSLMLSATLARRAAPAAMAVAVRVRNLSAIGLMADFDDIAEVGEKMIVTMRGIGSVAGTVSWLRRGRIGIAFDVEVDPRQARKPV